MPSNQPNTYQSSSSGANNALAVWSFFAKEKCVTKVVPDGCRDIIVAKDSRAQTIFISELSSSVYDVVSEAGDKMRGIRLEPGVQINLLGLNEWVKSHDMNELFIADQIDEFCDRPDSLSEALQCLSDDEAESIQNVANTLGVSLRTLQRVVKRGTQRPPYFWLSLSRMRRTAKSLHKFESLADVAAAYHYSDQAHMTRDLKTWLGLTPSQITQDSELLSLINEPGYV